MNTAIMIGVVVALLVTGFIIYCVTKYYRGKSCSVLSRSIIALEVTYDQLKVTETALLKEMEIYKGFISPNHYNRYVSLLDIGNQQLLDNVNQRKQLLAQTNPLPAAFKNTTLQHRNNRSLQRLDNDTGRRRLIGNYVKRLQSKTMSYFPALKALESELKELGKVTIS